MPAPQAHRFFILAGATWRGRLLACLGAALGIGVTGFLSALIMGHDGYAPAIAGPIGASALLLFAIPTSPLAQPWPIIAGNTFSAAIGVGVAALVPEPVLAIGLAVGLAIAAMSLTRSLHPPGSAMALTAALLGAPAGPANWLFPIAPVLLNSILLVGLGWGFHRMGGHAYPHRPAPLPGNTHGTADKPAMLRAGSEPVDIDAALAELGETFDIDSEDLGRLLRKVEEKALQRTGAGLRVADIMSRDVIAIGPETDRAEAERLLLAHNIRSLPVIDQDRRLLGSVGLRELARSEGGAIAQVMTPAATTSPETAAAALTPLLTDGRTHAVIVLAPDGRVAGLVSQTDLLASFARTLARQAR